MVRRSPGPHRSSGPLSGHFRTLLRGKGHRHRCGARRQSPESGHPRAPGQGQVGQHRGSLRDPRYRGQSRRGRWSSLQVLKGVVALVTVGWTQRGAGSHAHPAGPAGRPPTGAGEVRAGCLVCPGHFLFWLLSWPLNNPRSSGGKRPCLKSILGAGCDLTGGVSPATPV